MKQQIISQALAKSGMILVTDATLQVELLGLYNARTVNASYYNPTRKYSDGTLVKDKYTAKIYQTETICISAFKPQTDDETLAFFFHELGHATGASHRLSRKAICSSVRTDVGSAMEEVIAEMTSRKLMHHFGLNTATTDRFSDRYIKTFSDVCLYSFDESYAKNESDRAVDFILKNWLNEVVINKKKEINK